MMNIINENKVLEIEYMEDMERLVSILANNKYEVQVTPVYETEEDIKKRYPNHSQPSLVKPRIKYYSVKIVGKIEV